MDKPKELVCIDMKLSRALAIRSFEEAGDRSWFTVPTKDQTWELADSRRLNRARALRPGPVERGEAATHCGHFFAQGKCHIWEELRPICLRPMDNVCGRVYIPIKKELNNN